MIHIVGSLIQPYQDNNSAGLSVLSQRELGALVKAAVYLVGQKTLAKLST